MEVDPKLVTQLQRRLLAWYCRHRRDLPWRPTSQRPADPYHVFVSEAMLQQTQVATVIAYFQRFIAAFPTVADLAAAPQQQVLRLWQGLGYYRRARHLHAAAQAIVREHGGSIPRRVKDLLALPGVGRYTAGAIASIAYGEPAAILDGNVARVLARWFAMTDPIDAPAEKQRLWELAARLVPAGAAGDFNQAMMELGALVCTPRAVGCLACPVSGMCEARRRGMVDQLPARLPRRKPSAVRHHVVAVERGGMFLFQQRPGNGLWSSMWQMPTAESLPPQSNAAALAHWLRETTGVAAGRLCEVHQFTHQTTHRTITFTLWRTQAAGGRLRRDTGLWRRLSGIDDLPLSNPQRIAIARLQA